MNTRANPWELYDLVADRSEQTDLADEPPEIVSRMKAGLAQWPSSAIDGYNRGDYPKKK